MKVLDELSEPSPVPGVAGRRPVPAEGVAASPRAAAAAGRVADAARVQAIEDLRKPVFVPEANGKAKALVEGQATRGIEEKLRRA